MKTLKGEITVFLSLILMLILALVGTMIEVTRVNIAKVFAERALVTSMDSTLAAFYLPLFTDYHLLLLDMGYQTDTIDETATINTIRDYMEYSFVPNKQLEILGTGFKIRNLNLYDIKTAEASITDKKFVTDYNGDLFVNQISEYMKYKIGPNLVKQKLGNLSVLKKASVSSEVIKEKLVVEEKLLELDKYSIEIMELVEGISFGKNGLKVTSNGLIMTKESFVKQICTQPITMGNVGVDNQAVFNSIRSKYKNVNIYLDNIINAVTSIKEEKDMIVSLHNTISSIEDKLIDLRSTSNELSKNTSQKETEPVDDDLDTLTFAISQMEAEKASIYEQISRIETDIEENIKKIKLNDSQFIEIIDITHSKIQITLDKIDQYQKKLEEVSGEVENFEGFAKSKKDEVGEDFYSGIVSDIDNMKKYNMNTASDKAEGSSIMSVGTLKNYLKANSMLLSEIQQFKALNVSRDDQLLSEVLSLSIKRKNQINNYYTKELRFNYNGLKINAVKENPVDNFSNLIKNGILQLIIDDVGKISKNKIDTTNLPSSIYISEKDNSSNETDSSNKEDVNNYNASNEDKLKDTLSNSKESGYSNEISNNFNDFTKQTSNLDAISKILSVIQELVLVHGYIEEHFEKFTTESADIGSDVRTKATDTKTKATDTKTKTTDVKSKEGKKKKTVLEYEQEYIISGKNSDDINLKNIIFRILGFRTILNFIYLFGDSERSNQAYTAAVALVGFTGMTPLVQLTKAIILMVWAYEEALIDTSAIMKNKSVPLIKNKSNFMLSYSELFLINKVFIKNKTDNLVDCKGGIGEFTYKEYIDLFLLITDAEKKIYRCMDLIQVNMNERYEGDLRMKNCLYGLSVKAQFKIYAKFVKLPMLQRIIQYNEDFFEYNIERAYSY